MSDEYAERVRGCILDGESFVRAVFSGRQAGAAVPWIKVVVRPVRIKGTLRWQISRFDEAKDTTKNYADEEAEREIDELLALSFKNIHVETTAGTLDVRITKKGKPLIRETASPEPRKASSARSSMRV